MARPRTIFAPKCVPHFKDTPKFSYFCEKCLRILRPPIKQGEVCGHRFCTLCILQLFDDAGEVQCPGREDDEQASWCREILHRDRVCSSIYNVY